MRFAAFEHAKWLAHAWKDGPPRHNLGASGFVPDQPLEGLPTTLVDADITQLDLSPMTAFRADLAAHLGCAEDDVLVAAGTSGANTAAIASIVSPGDHVVCETPIYTPLRHMAAAFGARITDVPHGDGLDAGAMADAITDDTTLVLLASPNNPTGRALSESDFRRLGDAAAAHGAYVLADQVYAELSDDAIGADVHPNVLTTSGFNKCWGAPGLRLGWLRGPSHVLAGAMDAQMVLTLSHKAWAARMGSALLRVADRRRKVLEDRIAANHATYEAWCRDHGMPAHHGRLIAFLAVPHADTLTWAKRLLQEGILVVPGEMFGAPGGVRIGLTTPPDAFTAALAALGPHLKD